MTQEEKLDFLIHFLLKEDPRNSQFAIDHKSLLSYTLEDKKRLLRSMLNVRPPKSISKDFISIENDYLQEELKHKDITRLEDIEEVEKDIYLWQGDIVTLKVDGIVNAANSQMLGCFIPCHACIDNIIHSNAGVELRLNCNEFMQKQGKEEETGKAKITSAYNLPSKYILHTVGPIIMGPLSKKDCDLLASCYTSCLALADKNKLKSIAFCCISTGEFRFPNEMASKVALESVRKYKEETQSEIKVIFNVFKELDYGLYRKLFSIG